MQYANLNDANLQGADSTQTYLQHATLRRVEHRRRQLHPGRHLQGDENPVWLGSGHVTV